MRIEHRRCDMRFARERDEFIREMQQEAEAHGITEEISDPPSQEQIQRFFSYRRGSPEDAIDACEAYLGLFYRHSTEIRQGWGVGYPAGPSNFCDSWTEVFSLRPINGYRVIDCDGFAVLGVELLTIAGFQLVEYICALDIDRLNSSHAMAYMRMPQGTRGFIYISNSLIYRSLDSALRFVGFDPDRTRCGRGRTIREANEELSSILYWINVNSRIDMIVDGVNRLRRRIPFL